MFVYGYEPDTFMAVYPALQGTDTPRFNIFKNAAVYPADRLTENYRHRLKVRFVFQQLQMVQRAELVRLASPCPIFRVEIIAPLLRVVETDFHVYRILVFLDVLNNARYHHARKNTLATSADKLFVYFCRFHIFKILSVITLFFLFYPLVPLVAALRQHLCHCGKQFPVRVAVVVLVECPPLECDRMELYKLFLSRCLGDAHSVSVQ